MAVAAKVVPLGEAALSSRVPAFRRGLDVEALRQEVEGSTPLCSIWGLLVNSVRI
jgi:hypothetical protein